MSNVALPMPTSAVRSLAAWTSICAILGFHVLSIVLIFLRPDLDPSWHTISEWSIGPFGWLMSLAFLLSGVAYASLIITVRARVSGRYGRVGLALLGICVIGTFGVGIFTTDPLTAASLSLRGVLHVVFGASALILLPFAALFINLDLAYRNSAWVSALLACGGLPLAGFLSFAVYTAISVAPPAHPGPGVNIGWPLRFAFFTYMLWVVSLASLCIRAGGSLISNEAEANDA